MTTQFSPSYTAADAQNQQLAVDPTQMSGLRARMAKDPQGAAKEAASQFEALLMGTMLKTMRQTKFDDEQDSDMDTYRGMLDQQLVQSLSKAGGMGIANLVYQQIAKQQGLDPAADATQLRPASSGPVLSSRFSQSSALKAYQAAQAEAATAGSSTTTPTATVTAGGDSKSFVQGLLPHARQAAAQLGVAPEFVVAHAALESGWGKRAIRNADGSNSHNLFGIKATGDWQGKSTSITTTEYVNGVPQKRVDSFRSYDSYADAFSDYARMLKDSPRYQAVLNQGRNVAGFAQGLQNGGYATDPRYARKLVDVAATLAQQSVRS